MNIHEYQAKSLLQKFGVAVPRGGVAYTPEEAEKVARDLGGPVWVVKSQIHAGGRGAGRFKDNPQGKGGVRVVKSTDEVKANAAEMLGHVLVTKQTGPAGKEVKRVYVEEGCDIKRELYLGMLIDRATSRVTVMASTEGGMDIEEVAAKTPEKILKVPVAPETGLLPFQARRLAYELGFTGEQAAKAEKIMLALSKVFLEKDASLAEINPLAVTEAGDVVVLDAKIDFDDNALFRHPHIEAIRDLNEEDPAELRAGKANLNFIALSGNIGCLVNGAGLAMATMDIIKHHGGNPANFLDVGGGVTAEAAKSELPTMQTATDLTDAAKKVVAAAK